ncbi:nucleolar protein 12-domain-containing protein [Lipomyces chichibuensis]|uniref:nucleolar protein 12-domain-containing protein n=1 Tax=Lipomyces chichibuensis TaxID=1546026 RepID=UPI0033436E96
MSFQRSNNRRTGGGGRVMKNAGRGRNGFRPREIVFDSEAREQYLTGFHKRNVERKEKASERAKEHERREKLEERRALREQRKREIDEKVQLASAMYKEQLHDSELEGSGDESGSKDEEEWSGIVDSDKEDAAGVTNDLASILKGGDKVRHVQKYESDPTNGDEPNDLINGETTVIIENYDTDEPNQRNQSGIEKNPSDDQSEEVLRKSLLRAAFYAERVKKINSGRPVAAKKPKKKFRYLTSQERKANARKERARNKPRTTK